MQMLPRLIKVGDGWAMGLRPASEPVDYTGVSEDVLLKFGIIHSVPLHYYCARCAMRHPLGDHRSVAR